MTIQELYQLYKKHPQVCTDSRKVQKGDLFFALKGDNFDGNLYADKALQLGAAFAIVDTADIAKNEQLILVRDVLQTLQQLAHYHRKQFHIPFIGITGSNGKTTTKELLLTVLSQQYKTSATKGNLNNHIGVPLTLLAIPENTEIAIIEMGANHQHEIEQLCKLALPTHGLITNVGQAHLEGFGGFEGVKKAKKELYNSLTQSKGTIFINSDNSDLMQMAKKGSEKLISYGTQKDSFISGQLKKTSPHLQICWQKETNNETHYANTQLIGTYNFENVLSAICIGTYFEIAPEKIIVALENYAPTNSRSQESLIGNNRFILDAYNANPTSMQAAIENLEQADGEQKLAILGDMFELGDYSFDAHTKIIELLKAKNIPAIFIGKDFYKVQQKHSSFHFFEATETALQYLKDHPISDNTLILLKGSRGMQLERLLEAFKEN